MMLNQKEDSDMGEMADHTVTSDTEVKEYEGVTNVWRQGEKYSLRVTNVLEDAESV